jgi:Lipocalin-like domain
MKIAKLLSALLFLVVIGFSCEKVKSALDDNALITASKWKLTASTLNGINIATSCSLDDTETYSTNSWSLDEGATKCDPAAAQTQSGTWVLVGTKLTITKSNIPIIYDVTELTSTTLKLTLTVSSNVLTSTFSH